MRKTAIIGLSLCLSLGLSLMASLSHAADKWIVAQSPNFTVYSNVNAKATEAYVRNLEKFRYIIGAFYGLSGPDAEPQPRMRMYFLSSRSDLKQVWPRMDSDVAGFVRICAAGITGFSTYEGDTIASASKVQNLAENTSQHFFFHEYTHIFMFQNSQIFYPRWFVEGFAEYYGTTKILNDEAVVGMALSWRIRELNSPGALSYEEILRDAPSTRRPRTNFYAQSWLLTHWILSDPARREAFRHYLERRSKGEDAVVAFEAAFSVPVKSLSSVLWSYMNSLKATVYRIRDMPDPKISLSPMPVSADKLALWDAASMTCIPRDYRTALLEKVQKEAARYPDDAYAQGVLARAEIQHGDEQKGLAYYQTYTAAHPDDAEGFYRLGQTWYLMSVHKLFQPGETFDSQMRKAREAFRKAYALDPMNASNLNYLARAAKMGPDYPDDNTVNAAYQAHILAPAVRDYALFAAQLLIRRDRLGEAADVLRPLANDPHGSAAAERLGGIVAAIDAGKSKAEVLDMLKAPAAKPNATDDDEDGKKDGNT
ncbi:hypothetical protein [Asticcacaulis sp.]|uniref:hypothetical protein n=1 Tax=Asticcacaulis sp. TaxID=1872648 RepID=UPI00262F24A2|nr:hypothetical protein [Asticcacaulis sp.]